jgi:hypothetical protein
MSISFFVFDYNLGKLLLSNGVIGRWVEHRALRLLGSFATLRSIYPLQKDG